MASFEEVLANLSKETRNQFIMASEIERSYIPTPSVGLNLILGGGLPRGHITTFWGGYSAGKSTFLLQMIGQRQQEGNFSAAVIDTEKTVDPVWAKRLGVTVEELPVSNKSMVWEATDLLVAWINAGFDMVVVDSVSNLMPKAFVEKDGTTLKSAGAGSAQGRMAYELGHMYKTVSGTNHVDEKGTVVSFISQVRMDLGGFIATEKATGGKEVEHLDSLKIKLTSSKSESKAIKGTVQRGDLLMEEIIGRVVKWQINKNKVNGRYGVGEYNLITQGKRVGLDAGAELRDYGVMCGVIEKVGNSRFIVNGETFHGKDKTAEYIADHPDLQEFLAAEIESRLTDTATSEPVEVEEDDD